MFFNPERCRNETEVEIKFIVQYLLPVLGYTPDTWNQEVSLGNIRLDFLLFAAQIFPINIRDGSPICLIVEAKSPRQNLNPHVSKLRSYLNLLSIGHGILTNGKEIRIFECSNQEINLIFKCRGSEVNDKIFEIKSLIGREELRTRKLKEKEEYSRANTEYSQGEQKIYKDSWSLGRLVVLNR
ncbi:MAG: type I restriction enzyme HsdR N-terminal domain-containing protein [Richelia sp. SM2_1_7]|nr:type I restriction enzyme HsdR N-terminal domain-containing protein [Richelia sp. SM2_1_7]